MRLAKGSCCSHGTVRLIVLRFRGLTDGSLLILLGGPMLSYDLLTPVNVVCKSLHHSIVACRAYAWHVRYFGEASAGMIYCR